MAALATAGELETHLGRSVDPDQAELMLALGSGAVRGYCGWELARETTTFHFEGDGRSLVTLPTLELISVNQVRADGLVIDIETWPIRSSRKGQLRGGCWHLGVQYEVDAVHGYDPIPDLIKLCVLDMGARQVNNPMGLVSATTGQVTRTWASGSANDPTSLSALHLRLLDRYRL